MGSSAHFLLLAPLNPLLSLSLSEMRSGSGMLRFESQAGNGLPLCCPPGRFCSPQLVPAVTRTAAGQRPSRGWGFRGPPLPPLLQGPPRHRHPVSSFEVPKDSWCGSRRGQGCQRCLEAPGLRAGAGRRERSGSRGGCAAEGEENGEELGGRRAGKEGS